MNERERQEWISELREPSGESDKNWAVAVLLSALVGYLGADRLYLGYMESAAVKLLTLGGLGIWWLVDFISLVSGRLPDADGYKLKREIRWTPGLVVLILLVVVGIAGAILAAALSP